ncbi:MAG: hypothetical protein SPI28_00350, partial [Acetatifactor sp.]|nr:hypothetical protein [Acetatifactor sp.]
MVLKDVVDWALNETCSDIHITVGTKMAIRRFGTLEIKPWDVTSKECEDMIYSILDPKQVEHVKA